MTRGGARAGSTWEGGVREPAVVWAPSRVPAATQTMELVNMMDLFPTVLALAGVPPPPGVIIDGRSIAPLLADPSLPGPTTFVYARGCAA